MHFRGMNPSEVATGLWIADSEEGLFRSAARPPPYLMVGVYLRVISAFLPPEWFVTREDMNES